jgi:hypothetical protein
MSGESSSFALLPKDEFKLNKIFKPTFKSITDNMTNTKTAAVAFLLRRIFAQIILIILPTHII